MAAENGEKKVSALDGQAPESTGADGGWSAVACVTAPSVHGVQGSFTAL